MKLLEISNDKEQQFFYELNNYSIRYTTHGWPIFVEFLERNKEIIKKIIKKYSTEEIISKLHYRSISPIQRFYCFLKGIKDILRLDLDLNFDKINNELINFFIKNLQQYLVDAISAILMKPIYVDLTDKQPCYQPIISDLYIYLQNNPPLREKLLKEIGNYIDQNFDHVKKYFYQIGQLENLYLILAILLDRQLIKNVDINEMLELADSFQLKLSKQSFVHHLKLEGVIDLLLNEDETIDSMISTILKEFEKYLRLFYFRNIIRSKTLRIVSSGIIRKNKKFIVDVITDILSTIGYDINREEIKNIVHSKIQRRYKTQKQQ